LINGKDKREIFHQEVEMPEYVLVASRVALTFVILLALTRILGKKQISQLTFFDYIVGIVIGDMASTIAIDTTIKFSYGLIGLVGYTILSVIIAFGAIKSFKFRELVESSPSILIKDGKVMEKTLLKHRLTFDDLLNGLREKDAFNLSEIELAMLETKWTDKCHEKTRISGTHSKRYRIKCGGGSCPFVSDY
jgi:uncharacterized membrane protein YcaP (DUF421 family)